MKSPSAPYFANYQDSTMATRWLGSYERKYLRHTNFHIKRSLRFTELYPASPAQSNAGSDPYNEAPEPRLYVPRLSRERLQNEADALRFVATLTDVPVPKVLALFEDLGACFLITETVPGVEMSRLREEDKEVVNRQLRKHIATLHSLRSNILGGPGGQIIVPRPVMRASHQDHWNLMQGNPVEGATKARYVFCHGDLSEHNIIVDPEALQVQAILDWEHAGFWPEFFEGEMYTRAGPRACWDVDCPVRVGRMLGFLQANEVPWEEQHVHEHDEEPASGNEKGLKVMVTVDVETKEEYVGKDGEVVDADVATDTPISMVDNEEDNGGACLDCGSVSEQDSGWEMMDTADDGDAAPPADGEANDGHDKASMTTSAAKAATRKSSS
jgi:hypothetical protein